MTSCAKRGQFFFSLGWRKLSRIHYSQNIQKTFDTLFFIPCIEISFHNSRQKNDENISRKYIATVCFVRRAKQSARQGLITPRPEKFAPATLINTCECVILLRWKTIRAEHALEQGLNHLPTYNVKASLRPFESEREKTKKREKKKKTAMLSILAVSRARPRNFSDSFALAVSGGARNFFVPIPAWADTH